MVSYFTYEVAEASNDVREIVTLDNHVQIHDDSLVLFFGRCSWHDLSQGRSYGRSSLASRSNLDCKRCFSGRVLHLEYLTAGAGAEQIAQRHIADGDLHFLE